MAKKNLPCILVLVFVLAHVLSAHAQTDLDSVAGWMTRQLDRHAPETVYLQTSKSIYETGEDLWFKAYQLDAQTLAFSTLSQTLFLELRGKNDSLVWQEKYPIEEGVAEGHLYIDRELPPGDYFMEAFTAHSFRADSSQFSSTRKIRVVDNISGSSLSTDTACPTDTNGTAARVAAVHFSILPEGGEPR